MSKICPICNAEFEPTSPTQIYDTLKCRKRAEYNKAKTRGAPKPSAPEEHFLIIVRDPTAAQLNAICNFLTFFAYETPPPACIIGKLPADWTCPELNFIHSIEPEKYILT